MTDHERFRVYDLIGHVCTSDYAYTKLRLDTDDSFVYTYITSTDDLFMVTDVVMCDDEAVILSVLYNGAV